MRWKKKDKTQWHRKFAWTPAVTVCNTVVWLEFVEYIDHRYSFDEYGYVTHRYPAEYRLIEKERNNER